jgi:hypothetical protein
MGRYLTVPCKAKTAFRGKHVWGNQHCLGCGKRRKQVKMLIGEKSGGSSVSIAKSSGGNRRAAD